MMFGAVPPQSSWRHTGVRDGYEIMFASHSADGHTLTGSTTALEGAVAWHVGYTIATDKLWQTTEVRATNHTECGRALRNIERRDGDQWLVDGIHRRDLEGCVDVDFESSAVTNTLPIHRMEFPIGEIIGVPAAFVRAGDLSLERLEQTYTRLDDNGRFAYTSTTFGFACELTYDQFGLIVDYPYVAVRIS